MKFFNFNFNNRQTFFELSLLLILNFVVKGRFLAEANLGEDESFSVYFSQLPLTKIVAILSTGNNPPLHEIILHFWIKLAGISEGAVRVPSLIFNCLSVVPIYFIGEKFIRRGSGLVAALLFTFSTFSLFLSQEARAYNLVLFLTCCSFFTFLALCNSSKKWLWFVLILLNTLLLYAHYLAAWIMVAQTVAVVVHPQLRSGMLKYFLFHLAVIFLLFIPFLPILYTRFFDSGIHGTWVSNVTSAEAFYNMLWTFSNMPLPTVVFVTVILLALAVVIWRKSVAVLAQKNIFIILLWVWLPLIVSFLLSIKIGFFIDRYMFFTSPAYYLCVAAATIYLGNFLWKKYHYILPAFCVALMLFTFSLHSKGQKYGGAKKDVKPLVEKISELNDNYTAILICPNWFDKSIVYYIDRDLFENYFDEFNQTVVFKTPLERRNIYMVHDKREIKIPEGIKRVVYVDNAADFHSPQNGILDSLNSAYALNTTLHFDGKIEMYVFDVP